MNEVRVVLVLLCAGMAVSVAPGQSKIVPDHGRLQAQAKTSSEFTLYFPDYVDGGGWSVQLVLSNPARRATAAIVVAAFNQEGSPVPELFDSETAFEIPPLGSRVLSSAGTGPVRRGWIEVRTAPPSVSGLLTYRNSESGVEVGVAPVALGDGFALFVEESSVVGSGLAVFRPNADSRIELQLWDESGNDSLDAAFVPGDNFHQSARTLPEWFDMEGVETEFLRDFRGLLLLRTEDESEFAPLGLRFGKGTEALSAVPLIRDRTREAGGRTLIFTDYVKGDGWSVQLALSNVDPDASAQVVVNAFDPDFTFVPDLFDSETEFEIPPLGSRVLQSTGAGEIRRGWIEVWTGTPGVSGSLIYGLSGTGVEVGVAPVELGNHFALFVEETTEVGAGLALYKPDSDSRIELRLRDESGRDPLDDVFIPWWGFWQSARTISEWFDVDGVDRGFLRDFRGLLFLRTADGSPFAPMGLRFGKGTGALSAVPVIRIVDGDRIDGGVEIEGGVGIDGGGHARAAAPTVTLQVDPNLFDLGQSVRLLWSSTNAESAEITPDIGEVPTSGDRQVSPTRTTTYRITVRGVDGQTATESVTVTLLEDAVESDRQALEALYEATDGPNWRNNDNWLTDAPLDDWHGVRVGFHGRVGGLFLQGNQLKGRIPPELGNLVGLDTLWIMDNGLTGQIPPELGNLTNLDWLWIENTGLTGPIPPELGNLSSLEWLYLGYNNLAGPIPPELGALARLRFLVLARNELTGRLPLELGSLDELQELHLDYNDLAGPVPPEFSGMANLKELSLSNNPQLRGALPVELLGLTHLEALLATETSLCVPSDPGFQAWLSGVHKRRVAACDDEETAPVYLVQAAQSRVFPVPLVAGEKALLRVFPTASRATGEGIPLVRARFFLDGHETHVETIRGKSAPIPTEVDESSLSKSANAVIAGEFVQPGLEMVIEVDPEGTLDPTLKVARRIPETGRLKVDVAAMPPFPLTLIPFLWSSKPDSRVLDIVEAMVRDPDSHELLGETRTLLPIEAFALRAHEPVISSSNTAHELSDETEAIRVLEGGRGYYMGTITGERGSWHDGLADGNSKRTTFAALDGEVDRVNYVIAHELGHNLRLDHTPGCDGAGPDHSYPYARGQIGVWGYNFDSARLIPPSVGDLMSYCGGGHWISDYHFTNALRFRLFDENATATASTRSLLLWGGVSADSVPYLEPAFVAEAPAALPDSAGDYRIIGRAGDGDELFSLTFEMSAVADGDGRSSFAFALPAQPNWSEQLASITLYGPGGSVTLDRNTNRPVTILRNPRNGQIRGILRDRSPAALGRDNAVSALVREEPGLEELTSRGIPDPEDWTR